MFYFFFFNDTATTEIYTLSLHDALPISEHARHRVRADRDRVLHRHLLQLPHAPPFPDRPAALTLGLADDPVRSEEHTSELQSRLHLVCRLLLEKKKKNKYTSLTNHRAGA